MADVNSEALYNAISSGNVENVEKALGTVSNINAAYSTKKTPLTQASEIGNEQIIEMLLKKGAKIDRQDNFGMTPLMAAVFNNKYETAKFLLDKGASTEFSDKRNNTALDYAENNVQMKVLIEGAIAKRKDDRQKHHPTHQHNVTTSQKNPISEKHTDKPVHTEKKAEHQPQLTAKPEQAPLPTEIIDPALEQRLLNAIKAQDLVTIDSLLQKGVSQNVKDEDGTPAIIFAVETRNLEVVSRIINKDNINAVDYSGNTALMKATEQEDLVMIRELMSKGANAEQKNEFEKTAFDIAKEKGGNTLEVFDVQIKTNSFVERMKKTLQPILSKDSSLKTSLPKVHQNETPKGQGRQ